jgi:hypothetical protein
MIGIKDQHFLQVPTKGQVILVCLAGFAVADGG